MEKAQKLKKIIKKNKSHLLGAHFSIAGGMDKALYQAAASGCSAVQIFTKNTSTWKEPNLSRDDTHLFHCALAETAITEIAAHTSYLINPATPDPQKQALSRRALREELIRSSKLHIPYVILHPGSHMGSGETAGMQSAIDCINNVFVQTPGITIRLLLETTAGQGNSLGHRFEQLAVMLAGVIDKKRIGICLDTSHIFAAGYDIRTEKAYRQTMAHFNRVIGYEHLFFLHLNDSGKVFGSRVDRHEHIGEGYIGAMAFECIMNDKRLQYVPKVIETPKSRGSGECDKANLERLRGFIR